MFTDGIFTNNNTDAKLKKVLKSLRTADLCVCDEASSFLQSGFWGGFKSRFGWEPMAFLAEWESGEENGACVTKPLLVLRRKIAFGASLAYIPWGPELPPKTPCVEAVKELALCLKDSLPKDTVFIRFDLPWLNEAASSMPPFFIRSAVDIQVPDTVIVDLSKSMESIMEGMKPKWRYNVRLALKKGVTVTLAGKEKINAFYSLLAETAKRDGLAIHSFDYYKALFEEQYCGSEEHIAKPDLRLYLAQHEGELLAGIVTVFRGDKAIYLYGASSNNKRNFMAPYALQAKAMEDAKVSLCNEYDLFGISPTDDQSHPMAGLYRFKTGFGGEIIHRAGCWDYPCRPFISWLFHKTEILRKQLMLLKKSNTKARRT